MENCPPSSPGTNHKKFKFSHFDVQSLIKQEVRSAMEKNEAKLKALIETIEHLDRNIDYESTIQKLEARINMVSQRAEVALAQMAKRKTRALKYLSSDSEEEFPKTTPQRDKKDEECTEMADELYQIMETTKSALKNMHDRKLAVAAAAAGFGEERCPPAPAPEVKQCVLTKGPKNCPKAEHHSGAVHTPTDCPAPPQSDQSRSEQRLHVFPPLPSFPFPSVLSMEAASYGLPPKPSVSLALIRKPARLSVLWNVEEKDPSAPPMDSYTIYMSEEKDRGSRVFSGWMQMGLVQGRPLPMCVMISKYKPGHTVCVTVVGKDKFGRYGPYSNIVKATIPD